MTPAMKFKEDGQIQKTRSIQFENYKYTTDKEDEIEFIRNHREYGTEYKELKVGELAQEKQPAGTNSVETQMPRDQKEDILAAVDAKLDKIQQDIIAAVASMVQKPVSKKKAAES